VSQRTVITTFTAVSVALAARRRLACLIPGGQGRASVSEDAPCRNAAVAARLSSIRQS
jgi:hypothetical protein